MTNTSNPKKPSKTHLALKKIQAEINRLSRQMNSLKMLERKKDAREKIMLGGLIKKAGLENEASNVLLGLLIDAKEKLESNASEKFRNEWKVKGDLEFSSQKFKKD